MAKKKPVRKDPNRVPKNYIIPKPSDGIKDGEIPSLAEDAYRLIERYAIRHKPDNRSVQTETERLINIHTIMHDTYQAALIKQDIALSADELMRHDRINLSFLAGETTQWSMPEIPAKYLHAMQNALPAKPEELFFYYLPCFQSGILKVNTRRMMYFEITDLNLDDLTAKIHVTDYILDEDRKSQIGRSVLLGIDAHDMTTCTEPETVQSEYKTEAFTPDMSAALHQYKILTTDSFAGIYTKILPKQLGWNRTMVKFWEAVTLQNAVDQDEKFRRCGIDPADQLARYFIQGICLSNYFLSKHKPVRLDKDAAEKESDMKSIKKEPVLQPIDPNQPIKHVRKVGVIQFVSNKPPRKPSQKTARQYHVAVWTVRGHVRKYANGKTIYIRPTVRRRKALQDHINSRPQNIIEFHDNAKEVEKP